MSTKLISKAGIMVIFILTLYFQQPVLAAKDTQPPTAPRNLTATNITYTSIALSWSASSDDTGVKGYQVFRDGKKIITTGKTTFTNHDLVPGRKYTYVIRAYDAAGNVSDDSSAAGITTLIDSQIPSTPQALTVISKTYTSIELSWNPSTDNTGIKAYDVYCGDRKIASTSSTHYVCKSLSPGNRYTFFVKARDIGGNYSLQSSSVSASTTADLIAPSVPAGLKVSSISHTEATLTWSPSSDNVKVSKYEIFKDGLKSGTISKTSYSVKGLTPGQTYTYTIRAIDSSGNASNISSEIKFTTPKDTVAPTAPMKLLVKAINTSSVSLTWDASTDNVKVKGYHIYRNGIKVASTTKTTYTVKGKSGFAIGIYYIKAYDLVGNISDSSNKVTVINI